MATLIAIFLSALIFAVIMGFSFAFSAGLVWVICWAFGLLWSWRAAIGVWALLLLVSAFLKPNDNGKK